MKKILTKEELVDIIREKYMNSDNIESMFGSSFIIDMYINGYPGISNFNDEDFINVVKMELDSESIKFLNNVDFEVDIDPE